MIHSHTFVQLFLSTCGYVPPSPPQKKSPVKGIIIFTPRKLNIDTQNDGFKDVSPFEYGYFGYLC